MGSFSHVPGLLVLSGIDGRFPCRTCSPSTRDLPLGFMGTCGSPHISTELGLAWPSHCSILSQVPVLRLGVLFSFSPKAEPHFWPFSYTLVGMRLPCFTFQPAAVQTIPLWEEREGSQRFALSFLTELRPRRAGVLQNECHHLKEVTVVGAGVGITSQLHTITGSPVSENSTAQNSYPGQRRLQPPQNLSQDLQDSAWKC